MLSLTWSQVLTWRTRRQFIDPLAPADVPAVEIARRLCGLQAQVASAAELAVAVRGGSAAAVAPALARGELVKTWAMRGTLHLLPADQAPAYLALAATVRNWEKPSWQREFGATPADLEQLADAAREVLVPGAALTRKELTAELVARTGSGHLAEVLGSGWGTVLKPLAWWGVLCHGPARGTEVTFTRPPWDAMPSPEDAARIVLGAFLGAHGPATPEMFDAWLMRGMSRKREVKGWFEAMGRELVTVEVEGVEAYALAAHVDELAVAGGSGGVGGPDGMGGSGAVRMLGGFDPYILGAGTAASYLIPPQHRGDVSRAGGWIAPVVLHGGRVVGVWERVDGHPVPSLWEDVPRELLAAEAARVAELF